MVGTQDLVRVCRSSWLCETIRDDLAREAGGGLGGRVVAQDSTAADQADRPCAQREKTIVGARIEPLFEAGDIVHPLTHYFNSCWPRK